MVIREFSDFDDPELGDESWKALNSRDQTNTVFLTKWYQKAWWKTFGRGKLILLGLYRGTEWVGLAPLFTDSGMVFFSGSN